MTNTFQDEASKYFNPLPEYIRNCTEFHVTVFYHLYNKAYDKDNFL